MRTHATHSKPCALVQPLPSASGVTSSDRVDSARSDAGRATAKRSPYAIATRITQIDRAIIHRFHDEYSSASATDCVHEITHHQESRGRWQSGSTLPSRVRTLALPAALEIKLSALPAGYARVLADGDVLLVNSATREIVDVMRGADIASAPEQPAARTRKHALTSHKVSIGAGQDPAARWRLFEHGAIF